MDRRKFLGFAGVAALAPALAGTETAQPELFALLHDGYFSGDSSFYFPSNAVPYKAGMSLEAIKDEHLNVIRARLKEQKFTAHEIEDDIECEKELLADAVGAVIVPEMAVKAMKAIWESDPGCDSAVYGCNRSAKRVAWELKFLTIGKGMS